MDDRTKKILGYVGVGLAAALIAGAVIWAIMNAQSSDAQERADAAEEQVTQLESDVASLTTRLDEIATQNPPATDPSEADDAGGSTSGSPSESSSGGDASASDQDGRYFCYVREVVNETGTTMITVDYADMLTGDEAAAAASAAGEESPPPNDYWISNVNPLLRTFPVQSGINVTLTSTSDGTNPSGYTVGLGQWQDFFVGMSPGMEVVQDVPYWIEIDGGVVTSIEEQYLP